MILVTGGAGFIGSHLVRAFLEQGERVRVLDDLSTGHRSNLAEVSNDVELLEGSCADPEMASRAVTGAGAVIHLAARPSVVESVERPVPVHEANATGTLVMLDAARQAGVERFVFAGSSAVYGRPEDRPARESDAVLPLSPYGAQKLIGEHYCRMYAELHGLPTLVLRYFNVFGPRQDPSSPYSGVISIFCDRLLEGGTASIHGSGGQTRDFTYVDNVVQANRLALSEAVPGGTCLNIATGRSVSIRALYDAVAGLVGGPESPEVGPERAGDVEHSRADISRARELLGFEPLVDFEAGLQRTVEWYRVFKSADQGAVR